MYLQNGYLLVSVWLQKAQVKVFWPMQQFLLPNFYEDNSTTATITLHDPVLADLATEFTFFFANSPNIPILTSCCASTWMSPHLHDTCGKDSGCPLASPGLLGTCTYLVHHSYLLLRLGVLDRKVR